MLIGELLVEGQIYFDETSIGWEIIAFKDSIPPYNSIEELFEIMCRGAVKTLRKLGVNASFRPKNDIEVNGRKISGTGGTERENAILFQGTLLVDFDVETMIKSLRIPIVKLKDKELNTVKERVTCLKWELNRDISYEEVKNALKEGFEEAFEIELEEEGFTTHKKYLRERLEYFRSDEWIFLDRGVPKETALVHSITKKLGGVIRVSIALDKDVRVIKSVLITGDFFCFPSTSHL
ncbi:MAG: lipoate--protein ligase family protein [Candidatus Baldrarchaeia archaeon]